jgi:hypothetical protein
VWSGDADRSKGELETITADAPRHIVQKLRFIDPFVSTADLEYVLTPHGDTTEVKWRISAGNAVRNRVWAIAGGTDQILGPDLEEGLRRVKVRVERVVAEHVE